MPKVQKEFDNFKKFELKVISWMEVFNDRFGDEYIEEEKFRKENMEFKVNSIRADIDLLSKTFSEQKL